MRVAVGDVFERLTVHEFIGRDDRSRMWWRCVCSCGQDVRVLDQSLKSGNTKSCGCYNREVKATQLREQATTHGLSGTPEHHAWKGMKRRCSSSKCKDWVNYGSRGITVCKEWLESFPAFLAHIGNRPGPNFTVERINNAGNYEPGNVKWATRKEQMSNTRRSRKTPRPAGKDTKREITAFGKTMRLGMWAKESGIKVSTLHRRLRLGVDPEVALSREPWHRGPMRKLPKGGNDAVVSA